MKQKQRTSSQKKTKQQQRPRSQKKKQQHDRAQERAKYYGMPDLTPVQPLTAEETAAFCFQALTFARAEEAAATATAEEAAATATAEEAAATATAEAKAIQEKHMQRVAEAEAAAKARQEKYDELMAASKARQEKYDERMAELNANIKFWEDEVARCRAEIALGGGLVGSTNMPTNAELRRNDAEALKRASSAGSSDGLYLCMREYLEKQDKILEKTAQEVSRGGIMCYMKWSESNRANREEIMFGDVFPMRSIDELVRIVTADNHGPISLIGLGTGPIRRLHGNLLERLSMLQHPQFNALIAVEQLGGGGFYRGLPSEDYHIDHVKTIFGDAVDETPKILEMVDDSSVVLWMSWPENCCENDHPFWALRSLKNAYECWIVRGRPPNWWCMFTGVCDEASSEQAFSNVFNDGKFIDGGIQFRPDVRSGTSIINFTDIDLTPEASSGEGGGGRW